MYMHIVYIQYTLCEVLNEVPTKLKPKTDPKTNFNSSFFLGLGLGLVFCLVLGFVVVVYSAGQNIVGLFFWSYPLLFSAFRSQHSALHRMWNSGM